MARGVGVDRDLLLVEQRAQPQRVRRHALGRLVHRAGRGLAPRGEDGRAVRRASDPQRQALLRDLGSRPTSPSAAATMLAGRAASPSAELVYEGTGGVVAPQKYVETKAALVPPPPRETPPAASKTIKKKRRNGSEVG